MSSASRAFGRGREADEVGEQHRDEPALGGGRRSRGGAGARRRRRRRAGAALAAEVAVRRVRRAARRAGAARRAPHSPQNFRPSSLAVAHDCTDHVSHLDHQKRVGHTLGPAWWRAQSKGPHTRPTRQHGLARRVAIPDTRREVGGATIEPLVERALQPGILSTLVGVTLAAWLLVLARMRGMDAGPGTDLGSLGWYLGIWVTMMARDDASVGHADGAPVLEGLVGIDGDGRASRQRSVRHRATCSSWTAYGLVAYGLFRLVP